MDNEIYIHQATAPAYHDGGTVIIQGHYQPFDGGKTYVKYGFDWLREPGEPAYQHTQRVNVRDAVPINLGGLEPSKVYLILGHNKVRTAPVVEGTPEEKLRSAMLAKERESNTITITNTDGVVLGTILPGMAITNIFPGPIFAVCSHASALLHVTALPLK